MGKRTGKLTFLQINDTHGYLEAHPELFWRYNRAVYRTAGGYARIRRVFDQIRKERGQDAVIALDNGDTLHGTFAAVNSQGADFVEPLNLLKLDAMTVHWDFAYGPKRLKELAQKFNFPILAVNCFDKKTGELFFPPTRVIERGNLRVGIVGIASNIIDKTMPAHFSEGLRFTLGKDELPAHIRRLREEKVDVIVVLSHLGFPQDVKLATEISGIDVLLSGHTHNRMYEPIFVNGAVIIQSGCHGSFVGRLDAEFSGGKISHVRHQLIEVDETITPDGEMQNLIIETLAPHREMLGETVGQTAVALNRNTTLEATMDNLLLAAIAEAAGAPLAFSNGWRYGAPVPIGAITVNDLWNIIPTNPPVSVVELTGAEMRQMIEDNLERTFSHDAYKQMGGFVKRCLGVNIYCKVENPKDNRIQDFFALGERLDPNRIYTAAFVTEQGVPAKFGRSRHNLEIKAIDALKNYLKKHGRVHLESRGAVVAVY
jgi:sulfur-oxidizing protein SoxB